LVHCKFGVILLEYFYSIKWKLWRGVLGHFHELTRGCWTRLGGSEVCRRNGCLVRRGEDGTYCGDDNKQRSCQS